jgi:AcrR family transcriptional regulator
VDLERQTRRRGEELEDAILEAAWAQLLDGGYSGFTFESVASRAGTSRPVLYRRWANREELLLDVLRRYWWSRTIEIPDTGSLREDAIQLLRNVVSGRMPVVTLIAVQLADYFRDSGTTFAELREVLRGPATPSGLDRILDQAVARGELPDEPRPARVRTLPMDLVRHEMLMTMREVPEQTIVEIVDEIWLPMLGLPSGR